VTQVPHLESTHLAAPKTPTDLSLRALQRELGELLPTGAAEETDSSVMPLDMGIGTAEQPHLVSAVILEGTTMRSHRVTEPPQPAFAAFLDGTQTSQILRHVRGVPIIRGTVAAVVRLRRNRRMTTWRHVVRTRVYAPLGLLTSESRTALDHLSAHVVDTTMVDGSEVIEHPYAIRDAAIHYVQRHREDAEHELAKQWCGAMNEALFVDGGVSGNERMANDACIVGVVKSHRTLYATGDALRVILQLRAAERSSVFSITSRRRNAVASWYLRLRDPAGHDPMWGLVRVEIPDPAADRSIGLRAEEISRWILAEVSPIALPDARWDKMVYGIRDCEEWLRAII
jgi:hypothetical protein